MPSGAAAAGPDAVAAMPAATAKSRMAVGSTIAIRRPDGMPIAGSQPRPVPPARYSRRAMTTRTSLPCTLGFAGNLPEQDEETHGSQDSYQRLLASAERIDGAHRRARGERQRNDQGQGGQEPEL